MILIVLVEMTHQGTETRPGQRHGEGCHGNGAEIKDFRIDVEWRESLNQTKKSRLSINPAAEFSLQSHHRLRKKAWLTDLLPYSPLR